MVTDVTDPPPDVAAKISVPVVSESRLTAVPPPVALTGWPEASCCWMVIGPKVALPDAEPVSGTDVNANLAAGPTVVTVTSALGVLGALHERNMAVTV